MKVRHDSQGIGPSLHKQEAKAASIAETAKAHEVIAREWCGISAPDGQITKQGLFFPSGEGHFFLYRQALLRKYQRRKCWRC